MDAFRFCLVTTVYVELETDGAALGFFKWIDSMQGKSASLAAASPVATPQHKSSSSSTLLVGPKKTKHSYLILIIGIGVGVLIITIVFVLIICLCTSSQEKTKLSSEVTVRCKGVNILELMVRKQKMYTDLPNRFV